MKRDHPQGDNPVRIAQIGCGLWGRNIVRELQAHPNTELVAIVDPDKDALNQSAALAPQARKTTSIENISWHGLDAAVIATPGPLHASQALIALRYCCVFIEKPMTTSVLDAKALVDACNAFNRIGMVGHLLHHHGATRTMAATVRQGRIGTPLVFRSARLCERGSRNVDGSLLWSLAPHDISVLRMLDTSPISTMSVKLQSTETEKATSIHNAPSLETPEPNKAIIHLQMASGLEVHVEASRTHQRKVRRMEVQGEYASIVFTDDASGGDLRLQWHGGEEKLAFDRVSPLCAEIDAFVMCVKHGKRPSQDFAEGLAVVEILERAHIMAGSAKDSSLSAMKT